MEFLIIAVLIASNGILAMSEIALVSLRKSSLAVDAQNGDRRARNAIVLSENPNKFFSTVQIGITFIGIFTGIYSRDTLAKGLGEFLKECGTPESTAILYARGAIVFAATYLTLVFGELVPKRIGFIASERVAKLVSGPMIAVSKTMSPFVFALEKSTEVVMKLTGIDSNRRHVTESEIKSMIEEGTEHGEVQRIERDIVERVFSLGDRYIEAIMTPRKDIVKMGPDSKRNEVLDTVRKNPHSVYPVCEGNLDDIRGVVYMEDMCSTICNDDFSVQRIMRPVNYFRDDTKIYKALEEMRRLRSKSAVVCNEFGVTLGMITLNDLLDAVLGNMPEKGEDNAISKIGNETYIFSGQYPFHDFLIFFNLDDKGEDCHTIGGLLLGKFQRIPSKGDYIDWKDFRLEVENMDGVRIDKVRVSRITGSSKR